MVEVCGGLLAAEASRSVLRIGTVSLARQTLRAGIRAAPLEKPYLHVGAWEDTAATGRNLIHPAVLGSIWEQFSRGVPRTHVGYALNYVMSVRDTVCLLFCKIAE